MFSNLSRFWKGGVFVSKVLEEFKTMLESTETMYKLARGRLLNDAPQPDSKQKIWEIDKGVNAAQKDIRKRIVEHLSLQPTVDVNACLLMMSVVKDAERLGDYAKNLHEVTSLAAKPIDVELFRRYFDNLDEDILKLFALTREAFVDSDETKAEMAWGYERKMAKLCDHALTNLAASSLSVNEAVCLALVARHLKRIVAHLANIATSVVVPLSDLDYFDERRSME